MSSKTNGTNANGSTKNAITESGKSIAGYMSIDWDSDKTWKRVFEPVVNKNTGSNISDNMSSQNEGYPHIFKSNANDNEVGSDDERCIAKSELSEKKCLIKFDALEEIPQGF